MEPAIALSPVPEVTPLPGASPVPVIQGAPNPSPVSVVPKDRLGNINGWVWIVGLIAVCGIGYLLYKKSEQSVAVSPKT